MSHCLFCKMISGEIKAKVEYEDDSIFVIHDINPQAPIHVLIIPKKHIEQIASLSPGDAETAAQVLLGARKVAESRGWKDYRLVFNNGAEAGQSVYHIHMHLLSGRKMNWPPG